MMTTCRLTLLFILTAVTWLQAAERQVLDASGGIQLAAEQLIYQAELPPVDGLARFETAGRRLQTSASDEMQVVDSPLLQIEPGKRYKVRVHIKLESYQPETELDLLVREHVQATGAPLTPYQKIALGSRSLGPGLEGQWVTRHLLVDTTVETRYLSFIVALRMGPATVVIGGADVTPGEREVRAVELLMTEIRRQAATRERVLDRTLVMPRSQLKYGMGRNYLHWWHDRPLFANRSSRTSAFNLYRLNKPTFARELENAALYGLDGFASLTVSEGQLTNYQLASQYLAEWGRDDVIVYPEFWGAGDQTEAFFERYVDALETAIASPHAFRHQGKPVITSYIGDGWSPAQLEAVLAALKERVGDTFLFVCDIRHGTPVLHYQKGLLTVEDIEAERARLRQYLDICDGIMFMGANHLKLYYTDADYGDSINVDYLQNYLTPLFKSVLAEEPYRDKLLGLSAAVAYVNVRGGDAKREDRTRALRGTMAAVVEAKPDFIGFPEWNEFNENTCVSPTVYRSMSSQRIIRYFTHQLRGERPTANPGDDRQIPNLIVSYRRVLKLGEILHVELLQVPDGNEDETYEAQLVLLDEQGGIVREYPPESFTIRDLKEKTYSLSTEELADHRVLVPQVVIRRPGQQPVVFDQLLHVLLQATWNWNYLCVKQPLRDILQTEEASFGATLLADGRVGLQGKISAGEPLNTVEVLRNGIEVYAVDQANEFKREDSVTIKVDYICYRRQDFEGTVELEGASRLYARPVATDNFDDANATAEGVFEVSGTTVRFDGVATRAGRGFYLNVPRADIPQTTIQLDTDVGQLALPLKDLAERGRYARVFDNQFVMTLEIFESLPDLPVPVNASSAAFSFELDAEPGPAIYHLRAIALSGRTYRSRPIVVGAEEGPKGTLPVVSDTTTGVIDLAVQQDRLLDLPYTFTPVHGDLLATPGGRRWWAELGGGIEYGGPFNRGANYPSSAVDSSPDWVEEDNRWCLRFDGLGQYVNFPHETLPRGSFTLTMEIKPEWEGPQVLVRSHGIRVGAFLLKLVDGKLVGAYIDERMKTHELRPDLAVPVGAWSDIEVVYDLRSVRFRVNGVTADPIPLQAVPHAYTPFVFGGHTKPGFGVEQGDRFFKGLLRRFRLRHFAAE